MKILNLIIALLSVVLLITIAVVSVSCIFFTSATDTEETTQNLSPPTILTTNSRNFTI